MEDNVWSAGDGIAGDQGVFGISVAAELAGVPVQSLRLFETRGLIDPSRTDGGTRRYSSDDIARARHVNELQEAGLNLAGISAVLALEERLEVLAAENAGLHADLTQLRASLHTQTSTNPDTPAQGRSRKR